MTNHLAVVLCIKARNPYLMIKTLIYILQSQEIDFYKNEE